MFLFTPRTASSSKISSVVSSKDKAESNNENIVSSIYNCYKIKYNLKIIQKHIPPWIANWSLSTNSFLLPVVGSPLCFNSIFKSATCLIIFY